MSKPPRHTNQPSAPAPAALPVDIAEKDPATKNGAASRPEEPMLTRPSLVEVNPVLKLPLGDFPTKATINEPCRDFSRGRCRWGRWCHRIHTRRPTDGPTSGFPDITAPRQPRYAKAPLPPRFATRTVPSGVEGYVVKLPRQHPREGRYQEPSDHITTQPSCFIDVAGDSNTPIVRLRRPFCPSTNSSQDGTDSNSTMYRYEGLSWDDRTSFWGWKAGDKVWGNLSQSSDDSFTEGSSSAISISDTTSSKLFFGPTVSHTRIKRPPPPIRVICRLQDRCPFGYNCRYIHEDLDYDTPNTNIKSSGVAGLRDLGPPLPPDQHRSTTVHDHTKTRIKRPPPPSREICHKWLQDRCPFGYNCRYIHEDLDYDTPDTNINPPGVGPRDLRPSFPPEQHCSITVHDHTKVKLGSGFEIHEVTTSVETPWVVLGNIPVRVKTNAVYELLAPFGSVLDVKLPAVPPKDSMAVKACFSSHSEALQASTALDGSLAFGNKISARIPVNSRSGTVSIQDSTVRIQWEAPRRVAYGGYPTMKRAQDAVAASKVLRGDYRVSASIHVGLPSIGTVTVKFAHLPPDAEDKYMEQFGLPDDIMWERPNYSTLAPAVEGIKRIIRGLGDMLEFDLLPPPYSHGLIRAWATFASPSEARSATGVLHGRKPTFTGKTRIFAHHVQTLSYYLSLDVYEKNAPLIDALREAAFCGGHSMAVVTRRLSVNILIRLSADGSKELGWLKAEFEKILRGDILRRDGVMAWDEFFARPGGGSYLRSVMDQNSGIRIEVDLVRRILKLFGTPPKRAAVRMLLLQKISDLSAQRIRVIRVSGRVIDNFIATQLKGLIAKAGSENIFVNSWERAVTVRGGDELYEAAVDAVHHAQQFHLATPTLRRHNVVECPVCFNQVVSPITLRCGHAWCRTCLAKYVMAAIDNRHFPLTCLGDEAKCPERIPLAAARAVLQPSEFNEVVDASISSYVHSHAKEFHYCPSPDCLQIYRTGPKGTVVQCPACLLRICPHCHAESHDGFACPEQDGGDRLFKQWAASHDVKNCPGCAIPIERDEGCNHVTCIQCQTHICWVCLQTFPKGEGIYGHMRAEHGGIGLGPEPVF